SAAAYARGYGELRKISFARWPWPELARSHRSEVRHQSWTGIYGQIARDYVPTVPSNPRQKLQIRTAALAASFLLHSLRRTFISALSPRIRGATPLYFFVIPVTVRLTAPWLTRPCSFSYARKRSISSPPLAAFRSRKLRSIVSNKGLNSKEAFDESTAISSSVMQSGARRVKEKADRLDIKDYRTDPGNSDRG